LAAYVEKTHNTHAVPVLACIHAFCWLLQFYGHAAHEKRKPALLDNLFQAFLAAPIFVFMEVAYKLVSCKVILLVITLMLVL
jgi:uncharacterized membrane protein YGL010W